ncbi:uncharacterized protein BYT42DRAFT_559716 [Radiomyces spectabilis]|uniref:uncharacterized protein n=1 Tax=Radiomyces spectabilis TaxID=64574 RepID=UPI00221E9846|nr:uncharacterized protein BYT42DRAFT_559716 [Radiomyces spectabilis]KAI8388329.1 hypothetical protein BYT42DRAFT_559716 [Radiomyces spectabilis]
MAFPSDTWLLLSLASSRHNIHPSVIEPASIQHQLRPSIHPSLDSGYIDGMRFIIQLSISSTV